LYSRAATVRGRSTVERAPPEALRRARPRQELGAAGLTKRPTSCMLLLPKPPKGGEEGEEAASFAESFADVHKRVTAVQPSVF